MILTKIISIALFLALPVLLTKLDAWGQLRTERLIDDAEWEYLLFGYPFISVYENSKLELLQNGTIGHVEGFTIVSQKGGIK